MTTHAVAPEVSPRPAEEAYRDVAMACAVIAGTVHVIVAPEHLAQSWYVGTFFVVVGAGQLGLVLVLRRPAAGNLLLLGAIAANLGVIALYVASRTIELPFLPGHDHGAHAADHHAPVARGVGNGIPVYAEPDIEPIGLLDLGCLGAELVLVAMLVGMLHGRARRVVVDLMLVLGLLALGARATGLLG